MDDVDGVCGLLGITLLLCSIVLGVLSFHEDLKDIIPSPKKFIIAMLIIFGIGILAPSTKDALILMGNDYVKTNQRIGVNVDKALTLFEHELDKKLKEVSQ